MLPEVIVTKLALLVAVHSQPDGAATWTLPVPPGHGNSSSIDKAAKEHSTDPLRTKKTTRPRRLLFNLRYFKPFRFESRKIPRTREPKISKEPSAVRLPLE